MGRFTLRQSQRLAVEAAMRLDVANTKTDADAFNSEHALRHQHDTVAIRIDHRLRHSNIIARNQQLAIAGRRIVGQRLVDLVDLQDRAAEIVAVLLVPATDRLGVVERQADLVVPEGQRGRRVVGGKADVDAGFCEVHCGLRTAGED